MAAAPETVRLPARQDTAAAKILRAVGKLPLQIFLAVIALLWLVPTFGLLITSILPASEITTAGWWKIFAHPSLATFSNYSALFHNAGLTGAMKTTAYIAVGNTLLVVIVAALAGYAFAWLEFPGRDWIFIGVIALLVVPLQMALIPMFRLYDSFGIGGTVFSVILFHAAFGLPLAIFFAFQRYFVQGLLAGSVK